MRQTGPMKRILAALALACCLAAPAAADTLAQQVRAEATRLLMEVRSAETAAKARPSAKPAALSPALVSDLQRFGMAAIRLSSEIDQSGGPTDLRCIFRGMAGETDKQLAAISTATTGAAQARALASLNHMLSDAVLIAPAVGGPTQAKAAANAVSAAAQQCQVERDF
jgi:hypothetical protein